MDFELGTQEGTTIPIGIIAGFQQRERQDSENINNDTFYRPPVTSAQCIICTEKYPDAGILLNYDDDDYSQGHGQIKEASRFLTKNDILNPYIYLIKIFDQPTLMLLVKLQMVLVIVCKFLIYDIRKF